MQLPLDKNLLGTTKIYLFDNNLNLSQGRHIFKLNKIQFEKKVENNETNTNNINTNLKIEDTIERED